MTIPDIIYLLNVVWLYLRVHFWKQRVLYVCNKCGWSGYQAEHPHCGYHAFACRPAVCTRKPGHDGPCNGLPCRTRPVLLGLLLP